MRCLYIVLLSSVLSSHQDTFISGGRQDSGGGRVGTLDLGYQVGLGWGGVGGGGHGGVVLTTNS